MADQIPVQQSAPGILPCGYSYALGQGRLHNEGDAGGDYHTAYNDVSYLANVVVWGQPGNIADYITQIGGNGPIPHDRPDAAPTSGLWSDSDQVTTERHVYFYGFRTGMLQTNHGPSDFMLCLHIAGLASAGTVDKKGQVRKTPVWILPNMNGDDIPYFHLKEGSTLSDGQWVSIQSGAAAFAAYKQVIQVYIAIVGSMMDAQGLTGALEEATVKLIQDLPALANAISTGDAGDALSMLTSVVGTVVSAVLKNTNIADDLKNALRAAGSGGTAIVDFVDTAGKTVANVYNQADSTIKGITQQASVYTNQLLAQATAGIPGSWDQVLNTVVSQRGGIGFEQLGAIIRIPGTDGLSASDLSKLGMTDVDSLVGKAAQATARAMYCGPLGPNDVTAQSYFFDMAIEAANVETLVSHAANEVPDYMMGIFGTAATLRAAEIAAANYGPSLRSYKTVTVPRPLPGTPGSSFWTPIQQAKQVMMMVR
jgi:hypothetical protein